MRFRILVIGLVVGGGLALVVRGQNPPGMTCEDVIVVQYHPGPQWKAFNLHLLGHLEFLKEKMATGDLLSAGPFLDEDGGISIYATDDVKKVEKLVQEDPVVAHKAVTASIKRWKMCREAVATARPKKRGN